MVAGFKFFRRFMVGLCNKRRDGNVVLIQQRYLVVIMAFLAIVNAYQMRVCLNVAITEMVVKEHSNGSSPEDPDRCPDPDESTNSTVFRRPRGTELFDWSEEMQGLVLSSFYWGYVVTHMPGGILADRFGGKYSLGVGLVMTAVFTLLIPTAARGGESWLLVTRFLTGFGEGTTFPGINNLLAKWVPKEERALMGSFVYAGGQIGTITGTLITGALLTAYPGEWPRVFYVFGGIGMIWAVAFFLLCYSTPETHPFITDKEKKFLSEKIVQEKNIPAPPWKAIFTSLPLLGLICAQVGHDWGFFTMVTDLPKYMADVLRFSIKDNSVLSSLPYVVMWIVSIASGWLCDQLIKRKVFSVTTSRRIFTTIAHIGPSAGIIGASYAGCDRTTVVILFCFAMGTMGCFYPGMKVNAMDLSPNYSGTLMAIVNGIGGITGIITPYLVGVLTPNHTLVEWRTVFWITVGVNLVTIVVFDLLSSGEVQYWNEPRSSSVAPIEDSGMVLKEQPVEEKKKKSDVAS